MGAAFSTITGNEIHDIHVQQLFTGAEMAGIKIHGAVDTIIARNHIYRCGGPGAIWLDWMTQGTRVTANLMHDNLTCDLFVEVNHGPFLVDNNVSLSGKFLRNWSQGGAYVHNLVAGRVGARPQKRETPLLEAHGTAVVGLQSIRGGDDRFFNNLFVSGNGLATYDRDDDSIHARGNVFFLAHATPSKHEVDPVTLPGVDPQVKLARKSDGWYLSWNLDDLPTPQQARPLVTTDLLGRARIPNLPFEQPDGSPYRLDTDYFGAKRNTADPTPGPFARPSKPRAEWKVWPVK
jgi:alpha-N-arabinofuranosidase